VIRGRFVRLAVGAALVAMGPLAPPGAHAQEPPPSSPPELGLPPATARPPEVEAPAVTARGDGVSPRNSRQADDESFGAAIVGTFTEPGKLVGALTLALGLGLIVGSALHFRRHRGRREPRKQSAHESLPGAPAKLEARQGKTDRLRKRKRTGRRASSSTWYHRSCVRPSLP
jgi:hypothetical protein